MREDDDTVREPREDGSRFSSFLRANRSRRPSAAILVIVAIAIAAPLGWYVFRTQVAPRAPGPVPVPSTRPAADPAPSPSTLVTVEPIDLPAIDTSDDVVRRLVAQLSAHPQFARWLVTDELVRRFVRTIVDLAHGSSPTRHLPFMEPGSPLGVRESTGDIEIDPASYRRYDLIAETFASLDTEGTARLMRQLDPLFEEAHRELGLPDRSFDRDLARAIANLLAVNVPEPPPALVRHETAWEYADPALEGRSAAAKHLMRMGPQNARRVQAKLRELADALGIAPEG